MEEKLIYDNYDNNEKNKSQKNEDKLKVSSTNKSAAHIDEIEEEKLQYKTKKINNINYQEEFREDFSDKIKKEFEYNTLNESVCQTLKRDLIRIWNKLSVVIVPVSNKEKDNELRHWDLWGPFLFCILLGL